MKFLQVSLTRETVVKRLGNSLSKAEKLKNSVKNLSIALQAVINPLDNQLGYMG